jgi:hypothetical protein
MAGYFQMQTELEMAPFEKPWVETISFDVLDHMRLQTWMRESTVSKVGLGDDHEAMAGRTCEPVSIELSWVPVRVFQKRIRRSAVPPPEARMPRWCGLQAMALTAALCSSNFHSGSPPSKPFQTSSLLSLPPLAS